MKKLTYSEIENICESLSMLIHSGIGAGDGLFILSEENVDKKELLCEMKKQLDNGCPLSAAMEKSGVFPTYVYRMTRVGERTGHIEDVLQSMAEYYRARRLTEQKVRDTLIYPVLLCGVMLAVFAFLVIRVLPIFDDVYRSLGSSLDGAAGALLHAVQKHPYLMAAIGIILAIVFIFAVLLLSCPNLLSKVTATYAKARGDRGIAKQFGDAHLAQVLELGLSSGISALDTLKMGADLFEKSSSVQKKCEKCRDMLESGSDLAVSLGQSGILSSVDCRLLSVGMKNGSGDAVMKKIARSLKEEAEYNLEKRISIIEPAIVMSISILIGFILISVMLPLLDIMSVMG